MPSPEDPDPFGVKALELAGLEIKQAGSTTRPSIDAFEYRPSPTSPAFRLSTQSLDLAISGGDSRRNSERSLKRISKRSLFSLRSDQSTTTGTSDSTRERTKSVSEISHSLWEGRHSRTASKSSISETRDSISYPIRPILPPRGLSSTSSTSSLPPINLARELPSLISPITSPTIATFAIDGGIVQSPIDTDQYLSRALSPKASNIQFPQTIKEALEEESEDDNDDFDDEENITIEEVSTSTVPARSTLLTTPLAVRARVVSIKRRGPPALPLKSPLRQGFLEAAPTQDEALEDQDGISSACSLSPDKGAFDKNDGSPNLWSEETSVQDNESILYHDLGRASLSISDQGGFDTRPDLEKTILIDAKETTPVASRSLFILPLVTAKETVTDPIKAAATTELVSAVDLTPIATTTRFEPEIPPLSSDHKSSISGSTLASITNTTIPKSSSEQSLVRLIQQGLSAGLRDDDEFEGTAPDYDCKSDDLSDYEDDAPVSPTSFKEPPQYSTPGAFEPSLVQ